MLRRVTLALLVTLPLAAHPLAASAQSAPKDAPQTKGATTAAAAPVASGAPAAAAPGGSAGAPQTVTVDMTTKPADQGMNGATYAVKLRDLEQRVDELKDQIRRSHTRLALLSDTIIGGGTAGSRAEIQFRNEMSNAFLLTRALFVLDGQIQYNRQDDSGALADQKDIPVYTGSVPPGDHTIQVGLTFQGNGYGVFSYRRGYKFEVKSSHSFTAIEGKSLTVTATAYEKGGVTTPLEQRPTVDWHEKVVPLTSAAAAGKGDSSAAAAAPAGAPAGAKK